MCIESMPNNILLTGPPRSGKTTVIERTLEKLGEEVAAGGLYSPEIRIEGNRVGFELVDVATGETTTLAHIERETGPSIGSYRVNIETVSEFGPAAIERARTEQQLVIIDEIAPMQVTSGEFVHEIRKALDTETPVLAAVQYQSSISFVEAVKQRDDAQLLEVTEDNREQLPAMLADQLTDTL